MRRIRLLVGAGVTPSRRTLRRVQQHALAEDVVFEHHVAPSPAEFQDHVRAAQGVDLDALAVSGDDTTVDLVLNTLGALNRVPLGLLPLGGRGEFARDLGLSGRIDDALRVLLTGRPQRVDVVRAHWPGGSVRFCRGAGVGLTEQLVRHLHASRLPAWTASHLYAAARAAWDCRPRPVSVAWKGGGFEGEAVFVAVSNTRGDGTFVVNPQARLDDGMLDVCIVRPTSRARLFGALPGLFRGTFGAMPGVTVVRTPWARLDGALPVALDGELPGLCTPVEFHCEPAAVRVVACPLQPQAAAPELQPLAAFQPV